MRELSSAELEEAYRPVKEYYIGGKLTEKRMLAAYMRAIGLTPNGEAWMMAKDAFEFGFSFSEAASVGLDSSLVPRTSPSSVAAHTDRGATQSLPNELYATPEVAPDTHAEAVLSDRPGDIPVADGSRDSASMTKGVSTAGTDDDVPWEAATASLEWFPKVCGPGDLIGDGARKLLGQPKVSPIALLARETAQNSWDARVEASIKFSMSLRLLSPQQVELLRSKVLVGNPGGINLRETLNKDEVWVLEVSDRGTKGLGGPVRPDLPVPPGQPMDFVNMVFNIGAPSDRKLGGGTYGFGKAVGYLTSGCGTTLIWSRSREQGVLESRLIGSAIGTNFEDGNRRYTGRHWWGVQSSADSDGTRVEPLRGPAADTIGNVLFEEGFDPAATGTSILIIDPQLGGASYEDSADQLAEAVLWNLWPKMVPLSDGRCPMEVDIRLNGESISMVAPSEHPYLSAYVDCLKAVRGMHEGRAVELPLGLTKEVRRLSPNRLLGYLAMTRFTSFGEDEIRFPDIDPLGNSSHHVCLMRHAELVVTYNELRSLDSPGYHWAAVFQPVEETDAAFSASEPPAHDEWIPTSLADRDQKSIVKVALQRIKEICGAFAAPPVGQQGNTTKEAAPTLDLANSLGALVASTEPEASPSTGGLGGGGGGGRGKRRKASVEIQGHRLIGLDSENRIGAEISVLPRHHGSGPLKLTADIGAADEARKRYELEEAVLSVEWDGEGLIREMDTEAKSVVAQTNRSVVLRVYYPPDITLDVDFSVSEL